VADQSGFGEMASSVTLRTSDSDQLSERFTDDYLPFLLAQASASVCAEFAEPIRLANVSNVGWRILASLRDEGEMSVGDLSKIVLTIQPRVTQILKELESGRLIKKRRDLQDKRRTLIQITAEGRERVNALMYTAKACEQSATKPLSPSDLRQLKHLLRKLLSWKHGALGHRQS
jgi:DNA-binding MarR family transcriptional regulator